MEECSPLLKRGDERFRIETFLNVKEAREVIGLLNTFRKDNTGLAFRKLFQYFVWRPNNMSPLDHEPLTYVEVVPDAPDTLNGGFFPPEISDYLDGTAVAYGDDEDDIDGINTAATDGFTLWINRTRIMNKEFDAKDTHFGKLPQSVSHFSAVMLHEFGHVLRKRADRTTVQTLFRESPELRSCYNEYQRKISKARETARGSSGKDRAEDYDIRDLEREISDEMEEWFADIYAKSFILYAFGKG
jgi:hypothetical protein